LGRTRESRSKVNDDASTLPGARFWRNFSPQYPVAIAELKIFPVDLNFERLSASNRQFQLSTQARLQKVL